MTLLSHPSLFAAMCARNLAVIRVYFQTVLGLLLVVVVICATTVSGCDRMSLNSLYWDVDAPVAHPFCDRF